MIAKVFHDNIALVLFCFGLSFFLYLLIRSSKEKLDVADFLALSAVGLLPAFSLSPLGSRLIIQLTGVKYPFVVLYGLLFLIINLYVYRIVRRLHQLEQRLVRLAQEIAIIRFLNM